MNKSATNNLTSNWKAPVGFYPTPGVVLNVLLTHLDNLLISSEYSTETPVNILDLFAGDGRIGAAVYNALKNKYKVSHPIFIEIQESEVAKIRSRKLGKALQRNVFYWNPKNKFNLIVSNPPFYSLSLKEAINFGFTKEEWKLYGKNLYTLGIAKGLSLLDGGGVLAIIAPFSWLRNTSCTEFRNNLAETCSQILIHANDKRTLFKDANQDIGIQFFIKRKVNDTTKTKWYFGYNDTKMKEIYPGLSQTSLSLNTLSRVNVGPIVWNRRKNSLGIKSKERTIPVIYGGNITHDATLNLEDAHKYSKKQYIRMEDLNRAETFNSPLILIRRTLRGTPGKWKVDSCLIEKPFLCSVENHVIAIQIPEGLVPSYKEFYLQILKNIADYYYFSGSPSISCAVVKKIVHTLEKEYIESPYLATLQVTLKVKLNH